jgi:alpha-ketoglutarate-dependent taurine dioxygenase
MIVDGVDIAIDDQYPNKPILVKPSSRKVIQLQDWLKANCGWLEKLLDEYGAMLFRNFDVEGASAFEHIVKSHFGLTLDYVYRSTPRTAVGDKIYTATEYPAYQYIPLHNENSYQRDWPMRLIFCCVHPADQGGETTLAFTSKVTGRIDPTVRERFHRKKIAYVRNYSIGVDLPWQTVFQTDRREEVERYCDNNHIEYEWKPDGGLRTIQVCQALAQHPRAEGDLWFNQAHLFHLSSLNKELRSELETIFEEEDFPRNVYYGDGEPIKEDILEHIRGAYEAEKFLIDWQRGDVLLLDNMLVCHGRMPYEGKRKVLVAMASPYSSM